MSLAKCEAKLPSRPEPERCSCCDRGDHQFVSVCSVCLSRCRLALFLLSTSKIRLFKVGEVSPFLKKREMRNPERSFYCPVSGFAFLAALQVVSERVLTFVADLSVW
eukprot:scaffold773_cov140-Skeletonema_marinoi.AAC.6